MPEQELSDYLTQCLSRLPTQEVERPDGDVVLKAIEAQHGIFVERAQKIHSFAHLTFQEYFAASYIAAKPDLQTLLLQQVADPRWREVVLLTASLLGDADEFIITFKATVDAMISSDNKLIKLLHWADDKARQLESQNSQLELRAFYTCLACILDFAHDRADARSLDIARARARAGALNLARALDLTRVPDLARDHDLASDIARDLDLIRSLDLDLALARARALARSLNATYVFNSVHTSSMDYLMLNNVRILLIFLLARANIERISIEKYNKLVKYLSDNITQIKEWGFEQLSEQLTALMSNFPSRTAPANEWQAFIDQLKQLLQTECNIAYEWRFTSKQLITLADYLAANTLLLECLNIVTVTDRTAIKNSLLLLPR